MPLLNTQLLLFSDGDGEDDEDDEDDDMGK